MISPHMEHRVSQLRHDVDDVYDLLDVTNENVKATNEKVKALAGVVSDIATSVSVIKMAQRRQGNRLDELQSAVDLAVGRLDRLETSHQRLETSHQRLEVSQQQMAEVQRQQDVKLDAILAALGARVPAGPSGGVEEPACVGADGAGRVVAAT
jgi:DNA repair ATPase RecN